jgi:hypothetical protein
MKNTFIVTESKVGALTLYVNAGDELIYAHTGYQHHAPEQLKNDLAALLQGDDPRSWDGNDLIITDQHPITDRGRVLRRKLKSEEWPYNSSPANIESKIIYNQDGPLPENMGTSGKRIFAI